MNARPTLLIPATAEHVAVGALVGGALAVGLLLHLQRPTVDRAAVLASLPWLVVGVALHALRGIVGYPDAVAGVLRFPWTYLLAATLAGLAWLVVATVVDPGAQAICPHYVGVAGIGALLPPTTVLAVHAGAAGPRLLVVWLVVPIVASLVTYVLMIGLGLLMPDTGYFARSLGAVVIFGLALDGVGTALALAFGFGPGVGAPIGFPVGPAAVLPLSLTRPLTVAGVAVWLRLVVAVSVLGLLAAINRWRPAAAERGLELATVASIVVAANTFLFVLAGGFA